MKDKMLRNMKGRYLEGIKKAKVFIVKGPLKPGYTVVHSMTRRIHAV